MRAQMERLLTLKAAPQANYRRLELSNRGKHHKTAASQSLAHQLKKARLSSAMSKMPIVGRG
jgi:hypothetical protein